MLFNTKSPKIECPECGYSEIQAEYDNLYDQDWWPSNKVLQNGIANREPVFCYCPSCGLVFDIVIATTATFE